MLSPSSEPTAPPTVLIVGAGIAGLLLAILLDQIDVPYQIFERAAVVKPLGTPTQLTVGRESYTSGKQLFFSNHIPSPLPPFPLGIFSLPSNRFCYGPWAEHSANLRTTKSTGRPQEDLKALSLRRHVQ